MSRLFRRFRAQQTGIAFTEYLILLALLTGVVIGAIVIFGGNLNVVWTAYAESDMIRSPADMD